MALNGAKKKSGWIFQSQPLSDSREKKHAAPNRRSGWLEAEAGSQGNDTAGKSTGDCAEIGAANVIGDLVGVKV
jgi:phage repressor protein C with HTH and peptisase S24 domain